MSINPFITVKVKLFLPDIINCLHPLHFGSLAWKQAVQKRSGPFSKYFSLTRLPPQSLHRKHPECQCSPSLRTYQKPHLGFLNLTMTYYSPPPWWGSTTRTFYRFPGTALGDLWLGIRFSVCCRDSGWRPWNIYMIVEQLGGNPPPFDNVIYEWA